jgi:hypothetical protein
MAAQFTWPYAGSESVWACPAAQEAAVATRTLTYAAQLPGVRPALSTKGRLSGGALPGPALQSPCNAGLRCSEASCRKEILL